FERSGLGVVIRQAPEAKVASGRRAAELRDPVVVRPVDFRQQQRVADASAEEAPGDADDAVDDLGLDAVALLVLGAGHRVRGARVAGRGAIVRYGRAALSARPPRAAVAVAAMLVAPPHRVPCSVA